MLRSVESINLIVSKNLRSLYGGDLGTRRLALVMKMSSCRCLFLCSNEELVYRLLAFIPLFFALKKAFRAEEGSASQ